MNKKISLGKYPYTYARVSVMRAELLKKEEYQKLLKMSLIEIISFLQSSQYKKEIDELAVKYSGVDLMEMALNKNLVSTWEKLKRISAKEVDVLIDVYLSMAGIWNIKTILRGLHTKTKPEDFSGILLPAGKLTPEELNELMKSESVEELLKKLKIVGIKFEAFADALETFRNKNKIIDIENILDREHYKQMISFSETIPSEGKLFRQFLKEEIETRNIMNILRLRNAGVDKRELSSFVIGKPTTKVKMLLAAETRDDLAKVLSGSISENAIENFISNNSLASIELELEKNLLKRTTLLLHQHPLTVDVILGYMFAKEIEVKNLKMLLKTRQLNLPDEFIEKQIVV